jgi:hypothetical protein
MRKFHQRGIYLQPVLHSPHRLNFEMCIRSCVENIVITVSHIPTESIYILKLWADEGIHAVDLFIAMIPEYAEGLPGGGNHDSHPLGTTKSCQDGVKIIFQSQVRHGKMGENVPQWTPPNHEF